MNKNGATHSEPTFIKHLTEVSYNTLLNIWVGVVIAFAVLYDILSTFSPLDGLNGTTQLPHLYRFFNSLYFSIITATTVGYGDITPMGFSKVLTSMNAVIGYALFAIFVSKLISHRQDISLAQIHKLTFEHIFSKIREGFFILRKDFDNAIAQAETDHHLSSRTWETLGIAYQEGCTLLESIPQFYDHDHRLYVVDQARERLLIEAVDRTMERLRLLLTTCNHERISITQEKIHSQELGQFIVFADDIIQQWKTLSPHNNKSFFKKLVDNIKGLKTLIHSSKLRTKN